MKMFAAALVAAILLPGIASAQVYTETNAGQTPGTAADTTTPSTGASLTTINGTLTASDIDLYKIYINSPGTFSATTNNAVTNTSYPGGFELDTALFLFDSSGNAIATNDDRNGFSLTSTLSSSNALLSSLATGFYYLGIGISRTEAVNSANQNLFQMGADTTLTYGPASGVNPTTLATFDPQLADPTPGAYQINLTGVTFGRAATGGVPEPATWAMMVMGFGAIGAGLRRRTTRAAVAFA